MPYRVNGNIKYGKENQVFLLKPGDIVHDGFFLKKDRDNLLDLEGISKTRATPTVSPEGLRIPQLVDLQDMNVSKVREFLENEFNVATLEKYLDQESKAGEARRKTVLLYIQKRISEMTGYEYPSGPV